jgi:iron complex transport system ATP-binding protein
MKQSSGPKSDRRINTWLKSLMFPKWVRSSPPLVQEALLVDPTGRRLVASLRRRWFVHCLTTALPFLALSIISHRIPIRAARITAISDLFENAGAVIPYIGSYATALAATKFMTHFRFVSTERVAAYLGKYVDRQAGRTRFLPRGDHALSAEQLKELNEAGANAYKAISLTGERLSNNSAVMVGCAIGAIVASPIAGLFMAAVAGPALVVLHFRTQKNATLRAEADDAANKSMKASRATDSVTSEHGLDSAVGLGVQAELTTALSENAKLKLSTLGREATAGHGIHMKTWIAGSVASIAFIVGGAVLGVPFVNLLVALGACQAVGAIAGSYGRDVVALNSDLKATNAIVQARLASQKHCKSWGGRERWRPTIGPRIDVEDLFYERMGEGYGVPGSFTCESGSLTALIGPNGSGKSTLLETFRGSRIPASGRVLFDGVSLRRYDIQSLRAGSLLVSSGSDAQFPFVLEKFFAAPNGSRMSGNGQRLREQAVRQLVDLGMARDVAVALVTDPESAVHASKGQLDRTSLVTLHPNLAKGKWLALFDEVAANLDYRGRRIAAQLQRQLADQGATVISAAHTAELVNVADTVVLLGERGRVIACGRPSKVLLPDVPRGEWTHDACKTEAQMWAFNTLTTSEAEALFDQRDGAFFPPSEGNSASLEDGKFTLGPLDL